MIRKILIMLSLAILLSFQAEAADQGGVELESVSEVEVTVDNGQGEMVVTRVDASMARVEPGDTVIFTNYYKNLGAQPAESVVLVNPVPEHMTYVAETAEGAGTRIEFSVDGGKSFAAPENLMIKDENDKEKVAEPGDYTHIRWTMLEAIGKDGAGNVSFKAKVK